MNTIITQAPALLELWGQLQELAARIDKGAEILGGIECWWESDKPQLLSAESRFRDLSAQYSDLLAQVLMQWKESGLTLELSFPGENGIATVAGKWTRCGEGEYTQIVARYTWAEYAACMETVKEE